MALEGSEESFDFNIAKHLIVWARLPLQLQAISRQPIRPFDKSPAEWFQNTQN